MDLTKLFSEQSAINAESHGSTMRAEQQPAAGDGQNEQAIKPIADRQGRMTNLAPTTRDIPVTNSQ